MQNNACYKIHYLTPKAMLTVSKHTIMGDGKQ